LIVFYPLDSLSLSIYIYRYFCPRWLSSN